jgi:hypothetical protein
VDSPLCNELCHSRVVLLISAADLFPNGIERQLWGVISTLLLDNPLSLDFQFPNGLVSGLLVQPFADHFWVHFFVRSHTSIHTSEWVEFLEALFVPFGLLF